VTGGTQPPLDKVGIESQIVEILPDRPVVRARLRITDQGFPQGDWLRVTVSARLGRRARQFRLAARRGHEIEATARSVDWTVVDLPLPHVLRGEYSMVARVFSADDRYRRSFIPSNCRVFRVTCGELVRVGRSVLEDIHSRGGYGNPAAEEQLEKHVRAGVVVATDGNRIFKAAEASGELRLEPIGSSTT
jgi:hypothetical protein